MKPLLKFEELRIKKAQLNEEASVPDLTDGQILQNRMKFFLDEEDEIYEGYGRLAGSWPYRQFSCYTRRLREENVKAAILENDYLKAVFLPEYGGRLWSLWTNRRTEAFCIPTRCCGSPTLRCGMPGLRVAWNGMWA